jgi:hypothetical protein
LPRNCGGSTSTTKQKGGKQSRRDRKAKRGAGGKGSAYAQKVNSRGRDDKLAVLPSVERIDAQDAEMYKQRQPNTPQGGALNLTQIHKRGERRAEAVAVAAEFPDGR